MSITIQQLEQEIAKHEAETAKMREALSILKGNAPQVKGYAYSETDNGDDFYFNEDGQLHRTDGPAIEWADGDKEWYRNGRLHRTDGPAVEWEDGHREWYVDSVLHRTDGPAVERADGTFKFYLNDEQFEKDDFLNEVMLREAEGTL